MKSNNGGSRFRAFGQRAIVLPSSSSSPSSGSNDGGPRVSLSEFLNRKLQKPSLPAGTVQCQLKPFSMLSKSRDHLLPNEVNSGDRNRVQGEKKDVDKGIYQQFKLSAQENGNRASSCIPDEGDSFPLEDELQESRKRRNPFQGENISGDRVVILGKGPEPKQRRSRESSTTNKKLRAEFNHYIVMHTLPDQEERVSNALTVIQPSSYPSLVMKAITFSMADESGDGFWDSDMLGIDNDEVGFSEAWEGVGSTSLGGIEWH